MFLDRLKQFVPILEWLPGYQKARLTDDLIAGSVVLFITVPQVIAYAFLAGLPPQAGLYAAIFSLICYSVFGSSKALAVGPTAIIAMMTLEAVSGLAVPGTTDYAVVATKLALLTGCVLLILRVINFGAVISFLSHAVVSGFITAAATLIIFNQIPTLLGISSSNGTDLMSVSEHLLDQVSNTNLLSFGLGLSSMVLLLLCRAPLTRLLHSRGMAEVWIGALTRSAPMYAVVLAIVYIFISGQSQALPIVGDIPGGLPQFQDFELNRTEIEKLLPSALLIAMVVFMESTSIGTAVAVKRREKIIPNQELVGLGFANIGSALFGGFPVAGSFARTIVNHSAGAATQLAGVITGVLVLCALLGFGWFFYYLPKSILAAIIVLSAWQLIDWHGIKRTFEFNAADAVTFVFTFLAVLVLGVESGILVGIGISFVLLIRSSSKPHIAVVGRWQGTEHFRNVLRHEVETLPGVLAVRIDESFYFVNSRYIETFLLNEVTESPELKHVLLICTATNFIDTSGLEMLELLSDSLEELGVTLHLAEVKGPVMDKLKETEFFNRMQGKVFFTTDLAMRELAALSEQP
ncbi:MAG: SulP family sulfate permease [Patiriisocius sp.]|jgi:SulP family sulfate permease